MFCRSRAARGRAVYWRYKVHQCRPPIHFRMMPNSVYLRDRPGDISQGSDQELRSYLASEHGSDMGWLLSQVRGARKLSEGRNDSLWKRLRGWLRRHLYSPEPVDLNPRGAHRDRRDVSADLLKSSPPIPPLPHEPRPSHLALVDSLNRYQE